MKNIWERLIDLLGDALPVVDAADLLPAETAGERAMQRRHRLLAAAVWLLLAAIPLAAMAWYLG